MPDRIDVTRTDADFIAFHFDDERVATAAERCFPTDFVRSGEGIVEYKAIPERIEAIRTKLEGAGFEWQEAESALTEDEMWPVWPEDTDTISP